MTMIPMRTTTQASWAVMAVFVTCGYSFSSWASRLPAIRNALAFDEQQMGLLVLCSALGAILALPLSGTVVNRLGARRAIVVFSAINLGGLMVAAWAVTTDMPLLAAAALALCGAGTGVWDAAMNLEGALVEQHLGRSVMPKYHAGFSMGTVLGAAGGLLAAWWGVPLILHMALVTTPAMAVLLVAVRYFLRVDHETRQEGSPGPGQSAWAGWLEPRTIAIGVVVLAAALTEGAANDWVGLAIVDGFSVDEEFGALALAVFLIAMTGMRLLGTTILDRWGRVATLRLCSGLALVGLVVFSVSPAVWGALIGAMLWGCGAALGFPVGMSAASDDPVHAAGRVSVVATIGYSAFFMGPPLIGFLADADGLGLGYRTALLVIAIPVVLGFGLIGATRPLAVADNAASRR